jgi:hypothetical protein
MSQITLVEDEFHNLAHNQSKSGCHDAPVKPIYQMMEEEWEEGAIASDQEDEEDQQDFQPDKPVIHMLRLGDTVDKICKTYNISVTYK